MGVTVINYHSDNGVFTAAQFQDELASSEQGLTLSGVGAHHQNAVAEREIGVVFNLARTMMLHAKLRWPKAVSAKLWPMVIKHTQHLVNHIPGTNNVCPLDLILRTTVPREHLRNLHVWGAPAYVLDPRLQDGHKIPKWEPRSRQGLHLGWSPLHASTVPLILNLTTGHVSPQFHVVFDDWFTTVSTEDKSAEDIEDVVWSQLFNDHRFQVHFDDDDPMELDDEWLTEAERLEKHQKAAARVRARLPLSDDQPLGDDSPMKAPPPVTRPPVIVPPAVPQQSSEGQASSVPPVPATPVRHVPPTPTMEQGQQRETPPAPTVRPPRKRVSVKDPPVVHPVRPRARPPAGTFKGMCAAMIALIGNHNLALMASAVKGNAFAYAAMNGYNAVTDTLDEVEYFLYRAITALKTKGKKGADPDFPTYHQAMASPDSNEWGRSAGFR